MAKKEQLSPQQIIADIKKRKFLPIYFLMGDEPYYIDKITDALLENVLDETEKDFNLTVLYGGEVEISTVISQARRYPMMSEYQLVILKEAQQIDHLEQLELYTKQPLASTILVINYKHKSFDSRKKVMKDIASMGVVYESKKLYDDKIPAFVQNYLSGKGLAIEAKAAMMVSDSIGADLNRLCGELDKLAITMEPGQTRVTSEMVEKNIGISKEFNNFELLKAVINRDVYKANQIQSYFARNPKANPLVVTLTVLYNFFSNLMLVYYCQDKSQEGIAAELKLKGTYFVRDYLVAAKVYNAFKTMEIISLLRHYDAKSKGFQSTGVPDSELLKELLYKMMH
ncbi:MAG: DNA polymerase III subunit delta [Bacteroidales bacterium]